MKRSMPQTQSKSARESGIFRDPTNCRRFMLAAISVTMLFGVAATTAQEKELPAAKESSDNAQTIGPSAALLNVDKEGNVVGRELESGRTRMIARLSPAQRAYLPVASPSGKWLCVRSKFEQVGGPDFAMLVMLERSGEGWRTRWTTDVGDWRGVPVFACGERLLIVGRARREHLGWRPSEAENREAEGCRDKARAEAFVFDVASGKRVDAAIAPLYATPFSVIGSPIDDERVLLTQWMSDTESNVAEYDVNSWRSRVLRAGFAPLRIDPETFAFNQDGAVFVASLKEPKKSTRIVERGALIAAVPDSPDVLVEIWDRDPAYLNKDLPSLWQTDTTSGRRERVLDHTVYFSGRDPGWVSILR